MSRAQNLGAALAPSMAAMYRAWTKTLRYEAMGLGPLKEAKDAGRMLVNVLWHDELFPVVGYGLILGWKYVTVVSQSKDGEVLARILQSLGLTTARGSSSRGGVRALVSAYRDMRDDGRIGVITVDGPRGPKHEVKDGPIYLAHKANALILPLRVRMYNRYRFANSWDNFQIPYPFSKCTLRFGAPYEIEAEKLDEVSLAMERAKLQRTLDELGEDWES